MSFPAGPQPARLIQNVERAGEVDFVRAQPLAVGTHDRNNCGQVKAGVDALESLFDCRRIGDVPVQKLDLQWQVLSMSARQIIENAYQVSLLQQRVDEVRAQEASTAGHEKAGHPRSLSCQAVASTKIGGSLWSIRRERRSALGVPIGEPPSENMAN